MLKGLLYPAKTFVCLLGGLIFYRRLRSELEADEANRAKPREDV